MMGVGQFSKKGKMAKVCEKEEAHVFTNRNLCFLEGQLCDCSHFHVKVDLNLKHLYLSPTERQAEKLTLSRQSEFR